MRILKAVLRVGGCTCASGIAIIIGIYLIALVINRDDRPRSREARELAARLEELPAVADRDNGYVYMLGFAAARGVDPLQVGMERADWIRRLRTDYELRSDSDPYSKSLHDVWTPDENVSFSECPEIIRQRRCFSILSNAGAELEEWLVQQDWMLARYETLLDYRSWRGIHTFDRRTPNPISNVLAARRAWFLKAWDRANRGDVAGVRELLSRDLEFWRLVLAESHTLLTKMVAATLISLHFDQANLVLKRLEADHTARAVPVSWREPFSAAERSLHRVFAFELRYVRGVLEDRWSGRDRLAGWEGVERKPPGLLQRLDRSLIEALFQMQDFLNKRARSYFLIANALNEPYARIPEALGELQVVDGRGPDAGGWFEAFYNFTGDVLLASETGARAYDDYAAQISDLEGVRRAALVVAELRSRGIARKGVEAELANAMQKSPYTGEPFTWDDEADGIVFDGIARRNDGRHVFWY